MESESNEGPKFTLTILGKGHCCETGEDVDRVVNNNLQRYVGYNSAMVEKVLSSFEDFVSRTIVRSSDEYYTLIGAAAFIRLWYWNRYFDEVAKTNNSDEGDDE